MTYELANSLQCQLRLQTRIEADSDSTQKHRIRNFPEGEFKCLGLEVAVTNNYSVVLRKSKTPPSAETFPKPV